MTWIRRSNWWTPTSLPLPPRRLPRPSAPRRPDPCCPCSVRSLPEFSPLRVPLPRGLCRWLAVGPGKRGQSGLTRGRRWWAVSGRPVRGRRSSGLLGSSSQSFEPSGRPKDREQARKVRTVSRRAAVDQLSATDREIVAVLSEHRVATTQQISTLLELSERTARYRLDRVWKLGMCGGRQPYADQGSAPITGGPRALLTRSGALGIGDRRTCSLRVELSRAGNRRQAHPTLRDDRSGSAIPRSPDLGPASVHPAAALPRR
jgi:hypothetical protein